MVKIYELFLSGGHAMLLSDPTGSSSRLQFTEGCIASSLPPNLVASVSRAGELRDILWTAQLVPIVTGAVAETVESMTPGAVQWVPIRIEGFPDEMRHIMNVIRTLDNALDFERSNLTYWPPGSEQAGEVGSVFEPKLRHDLEPDYDIFRLKDKGLGRPLVCTDRLKSALDERGVSGAAYTELT